MAEPSGQSRLKQWWSTLANDQKIAIVILTGCGIFALGFSYVHMREQINQPFMVPNGLITKAKTFYDQQNEEQNKLELMKTKDTDSDGLNDYVEQYTYKTSPYLADSDSDGILDSIEIAQGTNPNCPKGAACSLLATQIDAVGKTGTSTDAFAELLDLANGNAGVNPGTTIVPTANLPSVSELQAASSTAQVKGTLLPPGQMSPSMLRTYMLENGLATDAQLEQLTDTQLLQLYQDAYNQVQDRYNSDDKPSVDTIAPTP